MRDKKHVTPAVRHLHLIGAVGAELRTADFNGAQHLVVPVIAMVEGVVWASNAPTPELVLAEELSETPQQWNGRACFAGHPAENGTQVTANMPHILQRSFGVVFNASSPEEIRATKRLKLEAWLDPMKAEAIGPEAVSVIERIRRHAEGVGSPVEVSVGCFVETEQADGHYHGKEYHGIWRSIVSDHLAFLAEGIEGACSVTAGCGAPRASLRHLITADDMKVINKDGTPVVPLVEQNKEALMPEPKKRSLRERMKALLFRDSVEEEGVSDVELRGKIDNALRAVEPGYQWVESVYPDSSTVIYCVAPEDEWVIKRRTYGLAADGVVSLNDDTEEVEPVTTYQPVTAAVENAEALAANELAAHKAAADKIAADKTAADKLAADEAETARVAAAATAAADCGCGGRSAEGEPMTKEQRAELITALVGDKHSGFTVGDEKMLEAASDDRLDSFKVAAEARTREVKAAQDAAAAPKPLDEEAFMKAAPESIKNLVSRERKRETELKAELVTVLKAAQTEYSEAELATMSVENLERLAKVAHVEPSYEGLGLPRHLAEKRDDVFMNPPSPYKIALERQAKAKATVN